MLLLLLFTFLDLSKPFSSRFCLSLSFLLANTESWEAKNASVPFFKQVVVYKGQLSCNRSNNGSSQTKKSPLASVYTEKEWHVWLANSIPGFACSPNKPSCFGIWAMLLLGCPPTKGWHSTVRWPWYQISLNGRSQGVHRFVPERTGIIDIKKN